MVVGYWLPCKFAQEFLILQYSCMGFRPTVMSINKTVNIFVVCSLLTFDKLLSITDGYLSLRVCLKTEPSQYVFLKNDIYIYTIYIEGLITIQNVSLYPHV